MLQTMVEIPSYIYGFETGKSIPVMSQIHVGQDFVVSLDIKDYFPSIKQWMIKKVFQLMDFGDGPASILSELCTYKAFVPQGALTSPKISNIIAASTFGPEIHELCMSHRLNLSIYADDITISGKFEEGREDYPLHVLIQKVTDIVNKYGFWINYDKTKVMRPHHRQWVCGAVVNSKVNVMRKERLRLRGIVHNCRVNGVEVEAAKSGMDTLSFVRKFAGRLNWFNQLNPEKAGPLCAEFKALTAPLIKLHPAFDLDPLVYSSGIESVSSNKDLNQVPF